MESRTALRMGVGFNSGKREIPIYSLHGETRRPKPEMLQGLESWFMIFNALV